MEGDESAVPRAAELQLRHCLDARTRRWVAAEFFCSAIDRPWFLHNPMQARRGRPAQAWAAAPRTRPRRRTGHAPPGQPAVTRAQPAPACGPLRGAGRARPGERRVTPRRAPQGLLAHLSIPERARLARPERGALRAALGQPRRLSLAFLREERAALEAWRERARAKYEQLGYGREVPPDYPRQLQARAPRRRALLGRRARAGARRLRATRARRRRRSHVSARRAGRSKWFWATLEAGAQEAGSALRRGLRAPGAAGASFCSATNPRPVLRRARR